VQLEKEQRAMRLFCPVFPEMVVVGVYTVMISYRLLFASRPVCDISKTALPYAFAL
jgi:hypothetical protein